MRTPSSKPISCECISTRIGAIFTAGGDKPVFIMELHAEAISEPLIKYFNCNTTTKNRYTVSSNSDFAKLYRLTVGENPTKRFSEAKHLLSHFLESRFFANYEQASLKNGTPYFKVTQIMPELPCKNDRWTANGTLKKVSKKSKKPPPEIPAEHRKSTGQLPDYYRINTGQVPDDETPQAAISLGLEPVFNPTKTLPIQGKTTYTLDHTPDGEFLFNPEALTFYNDRLDVLLNHFEFEKSEAEALAKQATLMQFSEKTAMPYSLGRGITA